MKHKRNVRVPVTRRPAQAQLDVSGHYVGGGRALYLVPGSITDVPGGAIQITSFESATYYVKLRPAHGSDYDRRRTSTGPAVR